MVRDHRLDAATTVTRLLSGPLADLAALRDDLCVIHVRDAQLTVAHRELIRLVQIKSLQLAAIADFLQSENTEDGKHSALRLLALTT